MSYPAWLIGFSSLFVIAERIWSKQHRRDWLTDLIHIFVNSHAWGLLVGMYITSHIPDWNTQWAASWPFWGQIALLIPVQDFLQW